MKHLILAFKFNFKKSITLHSFLLLFLLSVPLVGKTAIIYPTNDSTTQEVIEFTHTKKPYKKGFFKKGDNVVIYRKDKYQPLRDTIQGFTEDGVIIDGQEVPIDNIKLIRGKSVWAFIFSIFSSVSLIGGLVTVFALFIGIGIWINALNTTTTLLGFLIVLYIGMAFLAAFATTLLILLGLALIFGLASNLSKRKNKYYSLRRKWVAKIGSKKLPVQEITKAKK